jgi:hypothetical protein
MRLVREVTSQDNHLPDIGKVIAFARNGQTPVAAWSNKVNEIFHNGLGVLSLQFDYQRKHGVPVA